MVWIILKKKIEQNSGENMCMIEKQKTNKMSSN